ncbi:MAG: hypothetical protein WBL80_10250 [Erysipelotrichaceae bacterium]
MKNCEICGAPIIAHKNLGWPILVTDAYRCPNCQTEYTFNDNPLHYILITGLFYLVSLGLYYSLNYELGRILATTAVGYVICFFIHLYFRTHMIFTKVRLKSVDDDPKKKLIDQIRKRD